MEKTAALRWSAHPWAPFEAGLEQPPRSGGGFVEYLPDFLSEAVERRHPTAVALSDDLYAHPEPAGQEMRSSQQIVELLRQAGYQVEYPCPGYPTGFRAVLDNGPGPSVAILTEYDSLPGLGHACGHNVHGSMSVLAAMALADVRQSLPGRIHVFGTPAEEEWGAKVGMSAQGFFDDMAAALTIHSWSGGVSTPDMDVLSLRCCTAQFSGLSAHTVAAPWTGHNALTAARKFLDLIDARRECFPPHVYVNGVILDGGTCPNILPDKATVRLELRTDSRETLDPIDQIVRKCAQGACIAMDCQVSFTTQYEDFYDMVRVPVLEDAVCSLYDALALPRGPVLPPSVSSDVGNVSYRCPTIQPLLSICTTAHPLHTQQFREGTILPEAHTAICQGGKMIAALAYRVLTDAAFRQAAADSWRSARESKFRL